MTKADLITGFLGAGKTTFLRKYAEYLIGKGMHIGIIENDFGAVNVDMMLLNDLEGENCELEMVSGGCDRDCHLRRFKTKLIALGMQGLDRVIVEPSGIYDVDEFFDALCEDPLDRFYEIGSVITIVDPHLPENMSPESDYMLASQLSSAGCVVFSKMSTADEKTLAATGAHLNRALREYKCDRVIGDEVIAKDFDELNEDDFNRIMNAGYGVHSMEKKNYGEDGGFKSLYYMNSGISEETLKTAAKEVFNDESYGNVIRIKGFFRNADDSGWMEINATKESAVIKPIAEGQHVVIVIGEQLNEEKINGLFSGSLH